MNDQQYEELGRQYSDFDDCYVKDIDPNEIIFDKLLSQVRKNGHVVENAAQIREIIKQNDNDATFLTPISVRLDPSGHIELMDGATRTIAALDAGAKKIRVSSYHSGLFGNDKWKWKIFQAQANEHRVHQSNTEADIQFFISYAYKSGELEQEVGYKFESNKKKFLQEASKWLKDNVYENNPKNTNWIRRRLEKATEGNVAVAYENYSENQAISHFVNHSGTGCTSVGIGPSNATSGISIRCIKDTIRLNPNLIGYATHDFVDHPQLKTHVLFWLNQLSTADDQAIFDARTTITNFYNKFQKAYNCFGGLWFLPQIKSGPNAENLQDIKRVR